MLAVLQLFLSSPKATLRFAAIRTLNKVAITQPAALKVCNLDMENLVTDSNRSIATLAITTLLKTGNESSIERLMKQISSFLSEISDEFKIVVVEAIKSLCLKFPQKHATLMSFLAGVLRDEGGFEYKRAVVDTIVCIVQHVPDAKEAGLAHLCEFIEDCEFTSLLVKILHILGAQGPRTPTPRKFIRFIYNRLILENSTVRAAAVQTLAQYVIEDMARSSVTPFADSAFGFSSFLPSLGLVHRLSHCALACWCCSIDALQTATTKCAIVLRSTSACCSLCPQLHCLSTFSTPPRFRSYHWSVLWATI